MKYLLALIVLFATAAHAQHVDVRVGNNSVGISATTSPIYKLGPVSIAVEGGIQHWRVNDATGNQLYVTPTLRYPITRSLTLDGGVGVSVFDNTKYGNKDISTHFQFADHIGLTYSTKTAVFGVRYVHASNAGIKKPNPGLDSVQATLGMRF